MKISKTKLILGLQHVLAMFGATVLVPFLTGMNPTLALLSAGVGTLLFHLVTKRIVPVFLGSSFAFIGAISLTLKNDGLADVKGGLICAGLVYVIVAGLVKVFGVEKIKSLFPPIVTGPIIMVIGLRLSPIAIGMLGTADIYPKAVEKLGENVGYVGVGIGVTVILTMIVISVLEKSFFRLVPILIAVTLGYFISIPFGFVDFTAVKEAAWFGLPEAAMKDLLIVPRFTITGIMAIAPIAFVVFIEHIGDITTNGAVVGKNFFENPGIHRTMLGDGIATIFAGLIGGPANTTYGENTGVLAVTKVYDPSILRIAAVFAICLSLIGKFGTLLTTIPVPVMGGVSVILFGMIASVGVRTMINANLDFAHSRNLLIASLILVLGIGVKEISAGQVMISGLALAALVGVILNKVLPKDI